MSKSIRIRTQPGDDGYIKFDVDLKQNFDFLEILSLKISQVDEYQNFCADYGVIAGRIVINGGFGVPNVNVSVFVPIEESDSDNKVISEIYPYTSPFPDEKNSKGIRYNLLPNQQQTFDHTPVGTFPEKREILDNGTTLEIYEKYYKYTTTTNNAGDYMLFGIPLGEQMLHYDMDVSDIGFLSARPYELMSQGFSKDLFESRFKFKSSNNLDSLAQIFSQNIPVTVEPYWCDSLSIGSTIGINRKDVFIDSITLTPTAIFFGSILSDDEKDSLNKNCRADRDMGKMNEVITGEGDMQAIRRTVDGTIESFELPDEVIDENGNWSVQVPMNIRKVITDEFGTLIPSPDGIKGVATEGDYRFKVSMDKSGTDKRLRERANFLIPNLTGNYVFDTYGYEELKNTTDFKINEQLSTITQNTQYSADTTNQYNYLEDFYSFRWKKVYTVKQYIGRYQNHGREEGRSFIGMKDILNGAGVNKFPSNRVDTNVHVLYTIICFLLNVFGLLVGLINGILQVVNGLITQLCQLRIPTKIVFLFCFKLGKGICSKAYKSKCQTECGSSYGYGCNKCKCDPCGSKQAKFTIELHWKCILAPAICKKCSTYCGDCPNAGHSCCRAPLYGSNVDRACGCPRNDAFSILDSQGTTGEPAPSANQCCAECCIKIPLIKLRCADEPSDAIQPTIFPTPFAPTKCNKTWVVPYSCNSCGGLQTPLIKDWVSCIMEPVAVWLKMLKFDFYNDWVSGSLYFPLIKRKRKIKKRRKKLGQLKKDKFCDFDCDTFQGAQTYMVNRIRLKTPIFKNPEVEIEGCKSKIRGNIVTNWYGSIGTTTTENLNSAAKELVLPGTNNNGDGCQITFDDYAAVVAGLLPFTDIKVNGNPTKHWEKEVQTEHGKPEYIETIDPLTGNETFVNIGGHGHHKNKCNRTRMMERGEYYKNSLDCFTDWDKPEATEVTSLTPPDITATSDSPPNTQQDTSTACLKCVGLTDLTECCKPDCGTNGVAGCNAFCPCDYQDSRNYEQVMEHGYVKMSDHDNALYYASIIKSDDIAFNNEEYKANLIMPIGVTELGSSTYCDIDDAPFIMDELSPTTFQVSMEKLKFRWGATISNFTDSTVTPPVNYDTAYTVSKIEDKDGTLNLRAYVEFSCVATVCLNTLATVQQSQIGTEIIDSNDLGVEIGNCFTRFINDPEIRGYFCRRFSGYKDTQLNVHYMSPGSTQYENDYQVYPEIVLTDGNSLAYIIEGGYAIGSEYNDEDEFVPGDACGFYKPNKSISPDYFYGVAQGQTSGFVPFPNTSNLSTSNFGKTAHQTSILSYPYTEDVINDMSGHEDDNNGLEEIKGIKFNRSQTPYHLYFGLVPGKTSLHKTVAKFFADKIDKVTLEGIGEKDPGPDIHNQNNITNTAKNPYSIYRTCLGQTQLPTDTSSGFVPTGGLSAQGIGCEMSITPIISQETAENQNDGAISITPTLGIPPYTYQWDNGDTTQTITNLSPGIYEVTVTDFTGCQAILGGLEIIASTFPYTTWLGCKVHNVAALPINDNTDTPGYVTYVDCNEDVQSNVLISSGSCYDICVAQGTVIEAEEVTITASFNTCEASDPYPSFCGIVPGGSPNVNYYGPNYTITTDKIGGDAVNIPGPIYKDLFQTDWAKTYYGTIVTTAAANLRLRLYGGTDFENQNPPGNNYSMWDFVAAGPSNPSQGWNWPTYTYIFRLYAWDGSNYSSLIYGNEVGYLGDVNGQSRWPQIPDLQFGAQGGSLPEAWWPPNGTDDHGYWGVPAPYMASSCSLQNTTCPNNMDGEIIVALFQAGTYKFELSMWPTRANIYAGTGYSPFNPYINDGWMDLS